MWPFKPRPKFKPGDVCYVVALNEAWRKREGEMVTVTGPPVWQPKSPFGTEGWMYPITRRGSLWQSHELGLRKVPPYDGNKKTEWKEDDVWSPRKVEEWVSAPVRQATPITT